MNIYREIKRLVDYGVDKGLLQAYDIVYTINRIISLLELEEFVECEVEKESLEHPQQILDRILDYAYDKGMIEENTVTYRDLFDTRVMDCLLPPPSVIINRFYEAYKKSPRIATDDYYQIATASNYIRAARTQLDKRWSIPTEFGELEITINLSKPEKDPKAIEAAKNMKPTGYPKCLLCKENEGYAGGINHPARQNHRIIPIELCQEEWFLQFSPYVYYHEHSIIFKGKHEPMKINKATFERLLEFVEKFPHYFIGSNADLPIVGGSILSHDHFQGGNYQFAMEKAPILKEFTIHGFEKVAVGIVKWPLSVIRLHGQNPKEIIDLADHILGSWKEYCDEEVEIIPYTGDVPHNTITPIARYRDHQFELDLVLRNNRTSLAHPLGIFHPHGDVHHIKKENIGLIEVMGLAVLPARLMEELTLLKDCLIGKKQIQHYEMLEKHRNWFKKLSQGSYQSEEEVEEVLRYEVGKIFERIILDAGVFKQTADGLKAFEAFMNTLNR